MDAEDSPPQSNYSSTTSLSAEDTSSDSSGSVGIVIPVVVALIGVVFGAIGIFFGLSSQSKIKDLEVSVVAFQESIPGQLAEATSEVETFEDRLGTLTGSVEALKNLSRMNRDSTAKRFETYAQEIEANRSQINENTAAISEIPQKVAASSVPVASGSNDEASTPAAVVPQEGVHIIESGDTFGRLSAKYGVPVQSIMDANPSLDPRRLRIGQAVNIPVPAE